jgi:hypothetical protein
MNKTVLSTDRVAGMAAKPKVTGAAFYFTSIENEYGKPITYWFHMLEARKQMKHMELVNWLATTHAMTRVHANALVKYFRTFEGPGS